MAGNESGYVVVNVGGSDYVANITNGVARLNVTGLAIGIHNITVNYDGDYYYSAAATVVGNVSVIDKKNVTVTIDDVVLVIGENTTFTGKVNGNVSDKLDIKVNGVSGVNVTIAAGTYTVVATFAGNSTHKAGSLTKVFTIGKENATIEINDISLVIGKNATFSAKVNGVTTSVNVTIVVNGVENATVSNVTATTYTVTATFNGNATHNSK